MKYHDLRAFIDEAPGEAVSLYLKGNHKIMIRGDKLYLSADAVTGDSGNGKPTVVSLDDIVAAVRP